MIITNHTRDIDYLKVYFGEPYQINEKISLLQPTIGDIIAYGEREYWSLIFNVTAISSDFKPELEDRGIDYEKVSDLEMFHMMSAHIQPNKSAIIFGDLNLSKLKRYRQKINDELVLYDEDSGVKIDRRIYMLIQGFLTTMHNIKKNPEFAGNASTKKYMIEDDRARKARRTERPWKSTLLPLISAMINSPGFKYDIEHVRALNLFAFMDSVARITAINTSNLLLQGAYAGRVDITKIDKRTLDWSRDLYEKTK